MGVLLCSSAISLVGAVVAVCLSKSESASKAVACLCGIVAAAVAIYAGATGLISPASLTVATPFTFANFSLLLNPLSGFLLIVINILALCAWIYGISYFSEYSGKGIGAIGFFMSIFIVAMNMVLTVDNGFWFLFFFELMSLSSYFLVVIERDDKSARGGLMYLIMAHVGFAMIMISYFIMFFQTGSLEFSVWRETSFAPAIASACFALGCLGFGCKAGMFPFHSWLPQAHPQAPSNVSALMSGGMIKIGIFGMIKVGMDLLGSSEPQLWWGVAILVIGAFSSVLGVAYALGEHDLKKLLAYHSVENIGIIMLGLGVAFMADALGQEGLAALALMAAMYHLINHAMFKGLLFLGAGSVLYSTGTRNMEKLGGLGKIMPFTSASFLLGSLAICAIPPLNGFMSEWFTYQSMFTMAMSSGALVRLVMAFGCVSLAITGALAITCFAKAFGVTFSGSPRSDAARNAKEVPVPMRIGMGLLGVACVVLGLGAPWISTAIQGVAAGILNHTAFVVAIGLTTINDVTGAAVSTPIFAICFTICGLIPFVWRSVSAKGGVARDRDPWACGYHHDPETMPVVAVTFATQVKDFLGPIFKARESIVNGGVSATTGLYSKVVSGAEKAQNVGDDLLVNPVATFVEMLGQLSRRIEHGNFRVYIMYVVVILIVFLILAVVM